MFSLLCNRPQYVCKMCKILSRNNFLTLKLLQICKVILTFSVWHCHGNQHCHNMSQHSSWSTPALCQPSPHLPQITSWSRIPCNCIFSLALSFTPLFPSPPHLVSSMRSTTDPILWLTCATCLLIGGLPVYSPELLVNPKWSILIYSYVNHSSLITHYHLLLMIFKATYDFKYSYNPTQTIYSITSI